MAYIPKPITRKYLFFISQDYSFPVLRPLQDEILKRGDDVQWFMYGDEIHKEYILPEEKVLQNIEEVLNYHPDAVFVPGNVVPSFIPGLKVQVFHGLPGEKRTKKGQIYHYIIRGMFDLYCTQGNSSTSIFNALSKKHGYFHVQETGWCKLDPLFQKKDTHKTTQKSIFFASTFSPKYTKAETLYPFILEMIKKYDYHWYITLHPKMNQAILSKYQSINSPKVTFVSSVETIEYFKKSHIMLCDISSIVFEYMTQIKPVVTFQSPQKNKALIDTHTFEELEIKLISLLEHTPREHIEIISNEVNIYHPYQDGKSSTRVLDCVEKMLEGSFKAVKNKPLNFFRNYKLRKALNYWKF